MRKNFEMTPKQLATLVEACRPVPLIALHCTPPRSAQENANIAWKRLGEEMGFDGMTVRPLWEKGERAFSAESI